MQVEPMERRSRKVMRGPWAPFGCPRRAIVVGDAHEQADCCPGSPSKVDPSPNASFVIIRRLVRSQDLLTELDGNGAVAARSPVIQVFERYQMSAITAPMVPTWPIRPPFRGV